MADTTDIKKGFKIVLEGVPFSFVEFQFVKPGKGQAFIRSRIRNLLSGHVIDKTFKSGDKLEKADVEERQMQYLYPEGDGRVFMDEKNFEQVTVPKDLVGASHDLMKDNMPCSVLFFNERAVDVSLPTFVLLEVTASEPGVRGDTSGNVTKPATVETGAEIAVPLFIRVGDLLKIDTRTHAYVERVSKQ